MDLQQRVQDLRTALATGQGEAFLAERLRVDLDGVGHDRVAVTAWLAGAPKAAVAATVVGVKRNMTFVDWVWPGVGAGVAVLSWDQDGLLIHALVQRRAR